MPILLAVANIPVFIPILCLVLGVALCLIEIFSPGFGVFGVLGIISLLAGIILRAISGASFLEIALIIIFLVILFGTMAYFTVRSAKKGRLSKSALVLNSVAVDVDMSDATPNFAFLLRKIGLTTTFLRPVGKAIIDGEEYEVISENAEIIEKGEKVLVAKVEGGRILVKKSN